MGLVVSASQETVGNLFSSCAGFRRNSAPGQWFENAIVHRTDRQLRWLPARIRRIDPISIPKLLAENDRNTAEEDHPKPCIISPI